MSGLGGQAGGLVWIQSGQTAVWLHRCCQKAGCVHVWRWVDDMGVNEEGCPCVVQCGGHSSKSGPPTATSPLVLCLVV